MIKLPRQVALVLEAFPAALWSASLVNALNQFSLEVVQAFRFSTQSYKVLSFRTGATVADSFPIDFPVETTPVDVHIAAVLTGDLENSTAITVKWQPIAIPTPAVRVSLLTGLSPSTDYVVRLAYI